MSERSRWLSPSAARYLLLSCACFLSVGSHFGSYLLGPIKSDLKTGEASFASLLSGFEVVNTITPLLSGFLVPKFGAARCGLFATGFVAAGQIIVVWFQRHGDQAVGGMVLGLLIFGLGIAPLAVVQESIIIGFTSSTASAGSMGRALAIGLVLGKTSSWVASVSAQPLEAISPRAPFLVATALSLLSFAGCLVYWAVERAGLVATGDSAGAEAGHVPARASKHAIKRIPGLSEVENFSDAFWVYVPMCALAGTWFTTIHLSSSTLQILYDIPKVEAANAASVILLASTPLYPVLGWLFDKRPHVMRGLYIAVPSAIAVSYAILLLLRWIVPYWLALVPAAAGIGSGPLLLVVAVPKVVEAHHASTALGIHKAVEMAGAVLTQAATSWILGSSSSPASGSKRVVAFLLLLMLTQLGVVLLFLRAVRERQAQKLARGDDLAAGGGVGGGGEYEAVGLTGGEFELGSDGEDEEEVTGGRQARDKGRARADATKVEEAALTGQDDEEAQEARTFPPLRSAAAGSLSPSQFDVQPRAGLKRVTAVASFLILSWAVFVFNLVVAGREGAKAH